MGPSIKKDHNMPKLPRSSGIKYVKFLKPLMTIKVMRSSQLLKKILKMACKGFQRRLFLSKKAATFRLY